MKSLNALMSKNGTKYVVAMRDGGDLWLLFSLRRAPTGDLYSDMFNKLPGDPDVHHSRHASGQTHIKSSLGGAPGQKVKPILISKAQSLKSFRGKERVYSRTVSADDFLKLNERCPSSGFAGVFEIPMRELPAGDWHFVTVDLLEPRRRGVRGPEKQLVMKKRFKDSHPHILFSLWRGTSVPILPPPP